MTTRKIPVCEPSLIGNEVKYVEEAVSSGWISSTGSYIQRFEKDFAKFCDCTYSIACANGTVAIHVALESLNIGPGDEVIVTDFSMIGTINAIIYTGATPVLVDCEEKTWGIDPEQIETKITKNTKAILVVHIYGHPANMDPILKIAKKHQLYVVEDAAEAHGALYKGKKAGSLGDVSAFSFYANKIITTGEGGMVVTNNKKIAERAELLRNHAFTKNRFTHEEVGYNYRLTNLQAAVGVAQMENADKLVAMRVANAAKYRKLLAGVAGISLPPEQPYAKNVYWMFGILVTDKFPISRDELQDYLAEKGVETRAFFVPFHEQPVFRKPLKFNNNPDTQGSFPVSDQLSKQGLYLPSSGTLPEQDLEYVVEAIKEVAR